MAIRDEISRLECEIAFISGKLDDVKITQEERVELNNRFIGILKKLNEYRKLIK